MYSGCGIDTVVRLVQPSNRLVLRRFSMLFDSMVSPSGSVTLDRLVHPSKADNPTPYAYLGSVTLERLVQPLNVLAGTEVLFFLVCKV